MDLSIAGLSEKCASFHPIAMLELLSFIKSSSLVSFFSQPKCWQLKERGNGKVKGNAVYEVVTCAPH